MKQLKYVFSDFIRHKRVNLFFLIQMVVVFLLVGVSTVSILSTIKGYRAVESICRSQAYVLADKTSNERFSELFANSEVYEPKLQELLRYIRSLNVERTYSQYSYIVDELNGLPIRQHTANRSFFEIFGLTTVQGRTFTEDEYDLVDGSVIPILVGYSLREIYSLGETYSMTDAGTGATINCKVVGILRRGASFYDFYNLSQEINLDYSYIKPMQDKNIESMSFSDIDMAISSTVFFTSNVDNVISVQQKSKELGLMDYTVKTAQEQIQWFIDRMKEQNMYLLGIALIIVIFAGIGMSANLSLLISKNMREYSIHVLCGGRYVDICRRLFLQIFILTLIAQIPTVIWIGLSAALLITVGFCVILSAIILIAPAVKMYSIPVQRLLKEET